jgi:hypothetical protein
LLLRGPNLPLDHYLPDLDLLQIHQSHRILDRDSYRPNLPVLDRGPKVVLPPSAVGLYFSEAGLRVDPNQLPIND